MYVCTHVCVCTCARVCVCTHTRAGVRLSIPDTSWDSRFRRRVSRRTPPELASPPKGCDLFWSKRSPFTVTACMTVSGLQSAGYSTQNCLRWCTFLEKSRGFYQLLCGYFIIQKARNPLKKALSWATHVPMLNGSCVLHPSFCPSNQFSTCH